MIQHRKDEHIDICLHNDVSSGINTSLANYRFVYNAMPEINLNDIDLSTSFLGKKLDYPILISSMTGGTEQGKQINQNLAKAAAKYNIAMGVGSQRLMLKDPSSYDTYKIRHIAPDILLFANIGAVQLNNGVGTKDCMRIVDAIQADALVLHLNPLQEAIQPGGDTNFRHLFANISRLAGKLHVPLIVKEVGCGIGGDVAIRLREAGVSVVDVAGAGGTSFAAVESYRRGFGQVFREFGIPTAECIVDIKKKTDLKIIASGGIENGIDIAKSLCLGADLAGLARFFLKPAMESADAVNRKIEQLIDEFRMTLFSAGISSISELKSHQLKVL